MKCPNCNQNMTEWDWDVAYDDLPLIIDISGYSCSLCEIVCLNMDKSKFDYYVSDGKSYSNYVLFQQNVDAGHFDWYAG